MLARRFAARSQCSEQGAYTEEPTPRSLHQRRLLALRQSEPLGPSYARFAAQQQKCVHIIQPVRPYGLQLLPVHSLHKTAGHQKCNHTTLVPQDRVKSPLDGTGGGLTSRRAWVLKSLGVGSGRRWLRAGLVSAHTRQRCVTKTNQNWRHVKPSQVVLTVLHVPTDCCPQQARAQGGGGGSQRCATPSHHHHHHHHHPRWLEVHMFLAGHRNLFPQM